MCSNLARILVLAAVTLSLSAQDVTRDGFVDVTVDRVIPPGALEAVVNIDAGALATTSLAEVVAKLEPVGVGVEQLRSVRFQNRRQFSQLDTPDITVVTYSFEVRVAAARLEPLSIEVDRLFHTPPPPILELRFGSQLIPLSTAVETARLAALPVMFEEARAKAEATLAALGQAPGPIVAIQDQVFSSGYGTSFSLTLGLRMARHAPGAPGAASDDRGVATIVRRRLAVPFDIAVIGLSVDAGAEQALKVLAPLGITADDVASRGVGFSAGGNSFNRGLASRTSFYFSRPAADIVGLAAGLAKLSPEVREGLGLSFNASLDYSPELRKREREKAIPGLVAEALVRAGPLARLLNLPLGNPRTISDGGPATSAIAGFSPFLLQGDPVFTGDFSPPGAFIGLHVEFAVGQN